MPKMGTLGLLAEPRLHELGNQLFLSPLALHGVAVVAQQLEVLEMVRSASGADRGALQYTPVVSITAAVTQSTGELRAISNPARSHISLLGNGWTRRKP